MPEKNDENSPKSARERRFFPEKIFENLHPRKQNFFPRKKGETVPEKATKVPEKNMVLFLFEQVYFTYNTHFRDGLVFSTLFAKRSFSRVFGFPVFWLSSPRQEFSRQTFIKIGVYLRVFSILICPLGGLLFFTKKMASPRGYF